MSLKRILYLGAALSASMVHASVIQGVKGEPAEISQGERATIYFRISLPSVVTVTVIDSDFEPVRTYDMGPLDAGPHRVQWDGTDSTGTPVPAEAYAWRIQAAMKERTESWEPAWLYSRPIEHITAPWWSRSSHAVSYNLPGAMRMWVRIGLEGGACMRALIEGEPRSAGLITEKWDGRDETGEIDLSDREDVVTSVFGYRLPQPCVIVRGAEGLPAARLDRAALTGLQPPVLLSDPAWTRRRGFLLADRWRPQIRVASTARNNFSVSLERPQLLPGGVQVRWFLDGRCVAQDERAVLPALITLQAGQIPQDGNSHFVTANLTTEMNHVYVGSAWTDSEE